MEAYTNETYFDEFVAACEQFEKLLGELRSESARVLEPVSYTHLDVYKRQVHTWTDTVWLTRDRTRPSNTGSLLGSITHTGNLAVGEDYLGTLQVTIPDGQLSGNYYIAVWSDAYNVIPVSYTHLDVYKRQRSR